MITENTLENKAKFFAQYWGQMVLFHEPTNTLSHVSLSLMTAQSVGVHCLLLKHVLNISDEDKLHIEEDTGQSFYAGDFGICIYRHSLPHANYIVNYLTSKGYLLYSWMGLTVGQLVEYGWVKLREVTNE